MSLSHTAAEYMLSDALLPDPSSSRAKGLRLELPSDRVLKFIAVGLPIFLVSLAFAREFSAGELWGQRLYHLPCWDRFGVVSAVKA